MADVRLVDANNHHIAQKTRRSFMVNFVTLLFFARLGRLDHMYVY